MLFLSGTNVPPLIMLCFLNCQNPGLWLVIYQQILVCHWSMQKLQSNFPNLVVKGWVLTSSSQVNVRLEASFPSDEMLSKYSNVTSQVTAVSMVCCYTSETENFSQNETFQNHKIFSQKPLKQFICPSVLV